MELIVDFAYPLPLTVIAEMLGIPADDRENFRVWSNAAVAFTPTEPPDPEMTALLGEFIVYLRQLVAQKRGSSRRRSADRVGAGGSGGGQALGA